ncbi:MAG: hypothetical protein QM278_05355 [Pseudomonadota bacterium]|nr:hypothetical protein [Pseudomonadota bacterium]
MTERTMRRYFNAAQITLANSAFHHAERLIGDYFRMSLEKIRNHRYDVRTLAYLDTHEVKEGAFAHLCKYRYGKDEETERDRLHFYRICLQDNRILDAVERAHSFIKLGPLLLYIAAHELVHVVRFDNGESSFEMSLAEKREEEEKVHGITREALKAAMRPDLSLVLDCFSNRYQLGDIYG